MKYKDPNYWREVILSYRPINVLGESLIDTTLNHFIDSTLDEETIYQKDKSLKLQHTINSDKDIIKRYIGYLLKK